MNAKNIIRVLLLVFVAASAAALFLKPAPQPQSAPVSPASPTAASQPAAGDMKDGIVVYYFYTTRRCPSCKKIEAFTAEAVKTTYAKQLADGSMQWKPLNTDDAQYKHFLKDYDLYTKSVIVSQIKDGKEARWKNLEDVWELLGDPGAFQQYVTKEIEAYRNSSDG